MRFDRKRFRHIRLNNDVEIQGEYSGNGIVIMALIAAAISSGVAVGIAKSQWAQFSALASSHKSSKANQMALNEADILRATGYTSLDNRATVGKVAVEGTDLYKEVTIGPAEVDDDGQEFRTCSVSIYGVDSDEALPMVTYNVVRAKTGTLMYDLQYSADYDSEGLNDRALTEYASKRLFIKHRPDVAVGSETQPVYVDSDGNVQSIKYSFDLENKNNDAQYVLVKNGNKVEIRDASTFGCVIGSCSTAASSGAKVVSVDSLFVLRPGVMVGVTFANAPTAYGTLNVNNTGAKPIRILDSLNYSSEGSVSANGSVVPKGRTDSDSSKTSTVTTGSNFTDNTGTKTDKTYNFHSGFTFTTYFTTTTFRTDTFHNFSHFYDLTGSLNLSGSGSLSSSVTNSGYAFALFIYDGRYWNLVGNAFGRTIVNSLSGSMNLDGSVGTSYSSHFTGDTTDKIKVGTGTGSKISSKFYGDYGDFSDCGCGSCFAKGSMVLCVDSENNYYEMPIEKIKIGQKIVGANGRINVVKALYNPDYGLKLGNRKLMSVEYNGRRALFSDEHEFYIKRGDKQFWATHCRESLEEENHVCPENGRAYIDNKYEEVCKLQGVDYWSDLPKNRTTEFDPLLFEINETAEEYYMYDGQFHNCKAKVVIEKGEDVDYPLYHILVDGNCSYFVDGFLVCCREFAADVDWFTYVGNNRLVEIDGQKCV